MKLPIHSKYEQKENWGEIIIGIFTLSGYSALVVLVLLYLLSFFFK